MIARIHLCIAILFGLGLAGAASAAEPLPIDTGFWKSKPFRSTFTGSYGVESRIEPRIGDEEKAVLDRVADLMGQDNREAAINALKNSALTSDSAALSFNLGNLQFEAGETEPAVEAFQRAIELYPNFRDAHRNLAVLYSREGEFEEAEEHLVRAIELGAQDGLTFGLLGYTHLNKGREQAGLQAYRLAQLTMPRETQWRLGEAQCLLALDQVLEAAKLFGELLDLQPTDAGIWQRQADAFLKLDRPLDAIANLEFLARMQALDGSSLLLLGNLYLNQDLTERGIENYFAALDAEPLPPMSRAVNALEYLVHRRLWDQAEPFAAEIEKAYLADNTAEPDQPAEAAAAEDQAADGPQSPEPTEEDKQRLKRARAMMEFGNGNPEDGARRLQEIVSVDPLDGQALLLLAEHHFQQGEAEKAVMRLEQAALVEDTATQALLQHAEHLVSKGLYNDALEKLEEAQKIDESLNVEEYVAAIRQLAGLNFYR